MRLPTLYSSVFVLLFASVGQSQNNSPELPVLSSKSHSSYISAVTFSNDSKMAASSDMKGNVVLWEVGRELKSTREFRAASGPGVEKWVWCVAISPDGKVLAAGSDDKTVWMWDIESGKPLRRVRGHAESVDRVLFLPDGKTGLSVDRHGGNLLWDVAGDAEPKKVVTRAKRTALSPDGKSLCISDGNDTFVADISTGKKTVALGKYSEDVAFSPDGKKVAKGDNSFPTTVQVWDSKLGKQVWASKGHGNGIKRILFTPDGKRILSIDGVRLHIWDSDNGDELGRYRIGGKSVATSIACSTDGKLLLLGDREGGVTLSPLPK